MAAGLYSDAEVGVFAEWLGIGPDAARRVLDIVAPAIAARALRTEADRMEHSDAGSHDEDLYLSVSETVSTLRARADEIERTP